MRPAGRRRWVLVFVLCLVLAALCLAPGIAGAAGKGTSAAKPKVVKELTELKTENSKTYLLSNGARQVEISSAPIQFKVELELTRFGGHCNPYLKGGVREDGKSSRSIPKRVQGADGGSLPSGPQPG